MSPLAGLVVVLLSSERTQTCRDACVAHVGSPRVRAAVCGRCFTDGDRAAWAVNLAGQSEVTDRELEGLLADADWAVRWGGVKALAKRKGLTDLSVLSDWVAASPELGCATAVHAAGARKQSTAQVLQPTQAAACWERRRALTAALEVELYAELQRTRLEALTHLSAFLGRPVTRVVLDAMKSRAPETDDLSASLLVEACHLGGPPAARALLDVGVETGDEPLVNRLLPIWAKQIDAQRPRLQSTERNVRGDAIYALVDLSPLSAPELTFALDDPDPGNRRVAANALARGEGHTFGAHAAAKLDPKAEVTDAARIKWVGLLSASRDPLCAPTLHAAIRDDGLSVAVRQAAVAGLSDCLGAKVLPQLVELQQSKLPELRAGVALALGSLPRQQDVPKLLAAAFADPEPMVVAAACHAAGVSRQRDATPRLLELADHADDGVRREAIMALALLEAAAALPRLIRSLKEDDSAIVRETAARALGNMGSAAAVPALIAASEGDKDAKVKFVAAESLRKLGFKRSSGSMSP